MGQSESGFSQLLSPSPLQRRWRRQWRKGRVTFCHLLEQWLCDLLVLLPFFGQSYSWILQCVPVLSTSRLLWINTLKKHTGTFFFPPAPWPAVSLIQQTGNTDTLKLRFESCIWSCRISFVRGGIAGRRQLGMRAALRGRECRGEEGSAGSARVPTPS